MKRNYLFILLMILLIGALLTGCGLGRQAAAGDQEPVSHGGPVTDLVSLVDALRAADAEVEPAGEVEQPFFESKGQIVKVNGEDVQVFEFASEAAAEAAADMFAPDGSSTDTTMITWVSDPHFFRRGKVIVLYVGTNEEVLRLLRDLMGEQFAGR